MDAPNLWADVAIGVLGGAIRVGTPFLFVSLGECLTEKSGRINLGLEGVLVLSAMAGFAGSYLTGSPWLGVLLAGVAGALLASLHGLLCSLPRVNDIATGIALMLLGAGLAFYLGKPLIQPQAAQIPSLEWGMWSDSPQVQAALRINALFPIGVGLAVLMAWALADTRWGLIVRMAGDSSDAARALGYSVNTVRVLATMAGGFIAGLIAVALVIFARWRPVACLGAALLFGGAGALGPALQSVGIGWGYHLFNAVPYALTLLILVWTCSPKRSLQGAPMELGVSR